MINDEHTNTGYLNKDFALFYLNDMKVQDFEFHYHDFNKIVIFIGGNVTYLVEGRAYKLKPWDIVLISSNQIHKPLINSKINYERIVIWINPQFLIKHNTSACNLLTCFETTAHKNLNLLRLPSEQQQSLNSLMQQIRETDKNQDFGWQILKNALFLQLVVMLNRVSLKIDTQVQVDIEYDETINKVIGYINSNLAEELSLNKLSGAFFLSKYYLMHKFKTQTGCSIHNYILQKRLLKAKNLLKEGSSVTNACIDCGFGDYSNFVRAFKKMFGVSPKKFPKLQ